MIGKESWNSQSPLEVLFALFQGGGHPYPWDYLDKFHVGERFISFAGAGPRGWCTGSLPWLPKENV